MRDGGGADSAGDLLARFRLLDRRHVSREGVGVGYSSQGCLNIFVIYRSRLS